MQVSSDGLAGLTETAPGMPQTANLRAPERFLPRLRLVMDEYQPGHLRRLDGDSEQRGE